MDDVFLTCATLLVDKLLHAHRFVHVCGVEILVKGDFELASIAEAERLGARRASGAAILAPIALWALRIPDCDLEKALVRLKLLMPFLHGSVILPCCDNLDRRLPKGKRHARRNTWLVLDVGRVQDFAILHGDWRVPTHDREITVEERIERLEVRARHSDWVLLVRDCDFELAFFFVSVSVRVVKGILDHVSANFHSHARVLIFELHRWRGRLSGAKAVILTPLRDGPVHHAAHLRGLDLNANIL